MKTLTEIIRAEIAAEGVLPFARFMELALYCPDFGYYEQQKDNVGQRGDFYTSVSIGEFFGEMLAFQFARWLEELKIANCKLQIVEAGAHDGKLAKDILNWMQFNCDACLFWSPRPVRPTFLICTAIRATCTAEK